MLPRNCCVVFRRKILAGRKIIPSENTINSCREEKILAGGSRHTMTAISALVRVFSIRPDFFMIYIKDKRYGVLNIYFSITDFC